MVTAGDMTRSDPPSTVPHDRPVRAVMVSCGVSATWLQTAAKVEGLEVVGLVNLDESAALSR